MQLQQQSHFTTVLHNNQSEIPETTGFWYSQPLMLNCI